MLVILIEDEDTQALPLFWLIIGSIYLLQYYAFKPFRKVKLKRLKEDYEKYNLDDVKI